MNVYRQFERIPAVTDQQRQTDQTSQRYFDTRPQITTKFRMKVGKKYVRNWSFPLNVSLSSMCFPTTDFKQSAERNVTLYHVWCCCQSATFQWETPLFKNWTKVTVSMFWPNVHIFIKISNPVESWRIRTFSFEQLFVKQLQIYLYNVCIGSGTASLKTYPADWQGDDPYSYWHFKEEDCKVMHSGHHRSAFTLFIFLTFLPADWTLMSLGWPSIRSDVCAFG